MSIPITLVAGYLGAGKTTLINRLLHTKIDLSNLAILVNDFGDINIDAKMIRAASADGQVIGLNNGCVCCTIQDDFSQSLERLGHEAIEHILMEASGVASPAKLKAQCHYPGFHPRACFVVIDAVNHVQNCNDKYIGYLVKDQMEQADVLVISKRDMNPDFILTSKATQVNAQTDEIITLLSSKSSIAHADASTQPTLAKRNPPQFTTRTVALSKTINRQVLYQALLELASVIERAKGVLETSQGLVWVQQVGASINITAAHDQTATGLVLIYQPDRAAAVEQQLLRLEAL
ncbi:MAG: hypothetical protein GXP16_14465 [Gammaproteobacteria bacterium]|nr:hypothetical protein [Gammaproteobacteria bacterium]